jgi:hypothetical protein
MVDAVVAAEVPEQFAATKVSAHGHRGLGSVDWFAVTASPVR